MNTYQAILKAEILKSKHSFAVWLSIAGTIANVVMFFVLNLVDPELEVIPHPGHPWITYVTNFYQGMAFMMLPLYVIILTSLIIFMEHRRQMWTSLYALPITHWQLYWSKMVFTFLLFLAAHILFIIGMIFSGVIVGFLKPSTNLISFFPHFSQIGYLAFKTAISILGLLALHQWLSWRFRHFIIPLTIGILGFVITALLGPDWPWISFLPYAPPVLFMPAYLGEVEFQEWGIWSQNDIASLIYFFLFLAIGYWDTNTRPIRI